MDKLNFYKSTKEFLSNYENKINNKLEEITLLIKEKYRNLKFLLPLIICVYSNCVISYPILLCQ